MIIVVSRQKSPTPNIFGPSVPEVEFVIGAKVVEVDVDAGPVGLLVLAEVHVYGCKEKCSVAAV